jgi:hypothetical protein
MLPDLKRDTVKIGTLLSVAEQIQAFGLGGKTGEIFVTNVAPPARINLMNGEVVDAQFGLRSGLEAAVALINLPDPQSEFVVGEKAPRRTINMPYIQVLCEAARVKDEMAQHEENGTEPPPHVIEGEPYLRMTLGSEVVTFPIRPGLTKIGRSTANDIVINDISISQRHATIDSSADGVFLKDIGSMNGTRVAGQTVKERWLQPGDSVQLGAIHCLFLGGPQASAPAG